MRGTPWIADLPPELAHLNLDLLDEHAFSGWPKGDLAGAGNGWILATTGDSNYVVLEAHDTNRPRPPIAGTTRWSRPSSVEVWAST